MNKVLLPPWPKELPYNPKPLLHFKHGLDAHRFLNAIALGQARQTRRRALEEKQSGLTGTWTELIYSNRADYTALSNFTTAASLLGGTNQQPVIPALFFDGTRGVGRTVTILARGVLGTTSTPTFTWTVGLSTTVGSGQALTTTLGVSAAITSQSGVSTKWWELRLDFAAYTPGQGSGNTTLSGAGYVSSPGGFASPFLYALEPTTPDTATWTSTMDSSVTQYVNVLVACGAANNSNTVTCKQLFVGGLN